MNFLIKEKIRLKYQIVNWIKNLKRPEDRRVLVSFAKIYAYVMKCYCDQLNLFVVVY